MKGKDARKVTSEFEMRLNRVRALVHRLKQDSASPDGGEVRGIIFTRANLGGLHMDSAESDFYSDVLGKLVEATQPVRLSEKTVEQHLQDAILQALDVTGTRPDSLFDERLDDAISALRRALTDSTRSFLVMTPVEGCPPNSQHGFGSVEFCSLALGKRRVNWHVIDRELRTVTDKAFRADAAMLQHVDAGDSVFARGEALETAMEAIDVLNFYGDLLQPGWKRPRISVKGTAKVGRSPIAVADGEDVAVSGLLGGGWGPTRFPSKRDPVARRLGYWRVSEILSRKTRTDFESALIGAMRTAGRASVEASAADALLTFVIALDATLGHGRSTGAKIAARTAQLIGGVIENRRHVRARVYELYGLRSSLAHNGRADVTAKDVSDARYYAKEILLILLLDKRFSKVRSVKDFKSWLEDAELETATDRSRRRKARTRSR
jgi:hypothetical protein